MARKSKRQKQLEMILTRIEVEMAGIDSLIEEMEDQFDGLSERAQEGERGQRIEIAIDDLENFKGSVEDAIEEARNIDF